MRRDSIAGAKRAVERAGGNRVIIELISTIIVYKFSELSREEVDAMIGIELQQTRVDREAKAEDELKVVLRQLNQQSKWEMYRSRSVGCAESSYQERIKALPIERLEDLGEALLDFTAMADLEVWLAG